MKVFIGIIILFSLLFLFGGLFSVSIIGDDKSDKAEVKKSSRAYISQPVTEEYSIKQLDSLSSRYNYAFTSANAAGSTKYP
ncbi:MAG: hypothetical protein WCA84_08355 [Ignavibacteriaceae bacterium]|jgi:hypothetical protein